MVARQLPATFAFREQSGPITSLVTVGFLGVLGAVLGSATIGMLLQPKIGLPAIAIGGVIGVVLGVLGGLRMRRRATPAPIEVTSTSVRVPRSLTSKKTRELPIASLRSIELRGTRASPLLVLGGDAGFVAFPTHAFVDEDDVVALRDTVRGAIAALPDGAGRLTDMDRLEADGLHTVRRRPRATQVLLGVVVGVFVFELVAGKPSDPAFMMRWGANAPALVEDGQWWRLFIAGFMHLSFVHIFLNASALLSLGAVVEKLLGSARFVAIALGASLCGNAASMLTHTHLYSAGASSLIFGLIGALLVVNVRFRRSLPAGFFLGARRWAWLLGINGFVSLLPGVDGLAHLGGLLGGALFALALAPSLSFDARPQRPLHIALASALTAAFVIALAVGGQHALVLDDARADRELVWAALSTRGLPTDRIAAIAQAVADDPSADAALIGRAEVAMADVNAQEPGDAAYAATLEALRRRR